MCFDFKVGPEVNVVVTVADVETVVEEVCGDIVTVAEVETLPHEFSNAADAFAAVGETAFICIVAPELPPTPVEF